MLNKNAAFFTRKTCPHLNYVVKTEVKILFAEIFAEMCVESGKSSVLIMTIIEFGKEKNFFSAFCSTWAGAVCLKIASVSFGEIRPLFVCQPLFTVVPGSAAFSHDFKT